MTLFAMTPEERRAMRDANMPGVTGIHSLNAYFDWGWKGCGYGQLSVHFDEETAVLTCNNECMTRESLKKILYGLADFIVDRAVLSDNPEDIPLVDLVTEIKEANEEYDAYLLSKGLTKKDVYGV